MWSDPEEIDNWAVSPRGAGWLFGGSVTREVHSPALPILVSFSFASAFSSECHIIVQSHKLPQPHRTRTSACTGRLQVHVRRRTRHGLERPKLLLPVRLPSGLLPSLNSLPNPTSWATNTLDVVTSQVSSPLLRTEENHLLCSDQQKRTKGIILVGQVGSASGGQ